MAISTSKLLEASGRYRTAVRKTLVEARALRKQTAFLCHSHKDEDLAKGLQVLLSENGWDVYIDWQDHEMPATPNRETASKIKKKIVELDWFLFLATPNSSASRWCPWEIGIADAEKSIDKILIIPTTDSSGKWHGNEYLQLYNQITETTKGGLAKYPAGMTTGGTYIRDLR